MTDTPARAGDAFAPFGAERQPGQHRDTGQHGSGDEEDAQPVPPLTEEKAVETRAFCVSQFMRHIIDDFRFVC